MPRNVRNFWLELDVDGKKTKVATGPVAKDGGFILRIKQRNKGGVTEAGLLEGFVDDETGALRLVWNTANKDPLVGPRVGEVQLNTTVR